MDYHKSYTIPLAHISFLPPPTHLTSPPTLLVHMNGREPNQYPFLVEPTTSEWTEFKIQSAGSGLLLVFALKNKSRREIASLGRQADKV